MKYSLSEQTGEPAFGTPVYVFEAPVRIWHWVNALAITVLSVTGYLIANPLPSVGGEASDHFVMGDIRMIHFIAGYVFAIGFAVRIYWAIVGNQYAREIFYLPIWDPRFAVDLFRKACFYLFIHCRVTKFVGHNPLARTTMFFFVTLVGVFMIFTGLPCTVRGLDRAAGRTGSSAG
jgi:Ni/Fe-hydrogenase 1 B-type cytochrome subunit